MNKQELVDAVAAKTGLSKAAAGEAIDAFIGTVTAAVTKGDTVQLIGFGSFSTFVNDIFAPRAICTSAVDISEPCCLISAG